MLLIVDMDECLVDLLTSWLNLYNKDYNDNLTREDIKSYNLDKYVKPECGKKIYNYLNTRGLYFNAEAFDDGVETVRQLHKDGHDICFATTAIITPYIHYEKCQWIECKFGMVGLHADRVIMIRNKALLRGDLMIDDYWRNLIWFKGRRILLRRPHNQYVKTSQIEYKDSWNEIYDAI